MEGKDKRSRLPWSWKGARRSSENEEIIGGGEKEALAAKNDEPPANYSGKKPMLSQEMRCVAKCVADSRALIALPDVTHGFFRAGSFSCSVGGNIERGEKAESQKNLIRLIRND
ncbi:unnamed protein product [Caenorhabditis auriculariae]|uniref:Uncharacterized protein n=1 Tax=Caenorhabditis auriculariae TaxID=2777116 RepID=A0A8S1HDX5_9PELO|nr:unnamed protein product [Caenorhabditis auriculariae]